MIVLALTALSIFAFAQRSRAIESNENTKEALKKESASRKQSELRLSRSRMQQAVDILHNRFPEDARLILKTIPPEHRQWEWHLLAAWCGPSTLPLADLPKNSKFSDPLKYLADSSLSEESISSDVLDSDYPPENRWDRKGISSIMINPGTGSGAQQWIARQAPFTVMDMLRTRSHGSIGGIIPSSDASMVLLTDFEHGNREGISTWSGRKYASNHLTAIPDRLETPLMFHYDSLPHSNDKATGVSVISDIVYELFQPGGQSPELLRQLRKRGCRSVFEGLEYGELIAIPNLLGEGMDELASKPYPLITHILRSQDARFRTIGAFETDEDRIPWIPSYMDHEAAVFCEMLMQKNEPFISWRATAKIGKEKVVLLEMARNQEAVLECWNINSGSKVWTVPWSRPYPMTTPDSFCGLVDGQPVALFSPSLEIRRLIDGKLVFKPNEQALYDLGLWGGARSVQTSAWISPGGDYAISYSTGYFGTDLIVFRIADGIPVYWRNNQRDDDDERLAGQQRAINRTPEASRLGKISWPRALLWETSGKYVAIQQGNTSSSLKIYESLVGAEVETGLFESLDFDWLDPEKTKFEINGSLNRTILGSFLLEADTWEPILKLPAGSLVFWDWSIVALKMNDGCYEMVHLPKTPSAGFQSEEPRNIQEYLLEREYSQTIEDSN